MKEILVIDDDPTMTLLEKKVLTAAGYSVTTCANLGDAVAYLVGKVPHLIILDINLGATENGLDLLRTQASFARVIKAAKVIVMSSVDDKKSIAMALSLGAQDYIIKPMVPILLLQKIAKILKDSAPAEYVFDQAKRPEVNARISAEMMAISEQEVVLEGPFKLALGQRVECHGPIFQSIFKSHCRFVSKHPSITVGERGMTNALEIVGANEETYQNIRRLSKIKKGKN